MTSDPRVVLVTGDETRHRFIAHRIHDSMPLVGVVSEAKRSYVKQEPHDEDEKLLHDHFSERESTEQQMFGESETFPPVDLLTASTGEVNEQHVREWIQRLAPDVVILFGCSIIKPPLLQDYPDRMINIHLGLSPYYRGAGTNFWPLVHDKPECVGATIHVATLKVDGGSILGQVRPEPRADDDSHTFGNRAIAAAAAALPEIVEKYRSGRVIPRPQDFTRGKEFRRKDLSADAIRQMRDLFRNGMMRRYIEQLEQRQAPYPIVEIAR